MDQKKIANTLEAYFSDANLMWDKTMQLLISNGDDGCVAFERLIKLQRMKPMNIDAKQLKDAASEYSMKRLKISDDGNSIGRIKPYILKKTDVLDDWSIYVEGLSKKYQDEQHISDLFQTHVGRVSFVQIPANRYGVTQFHGFCFVEFDDKDNVEKAVEMMNMENDDKILNENDTIAKLGLKVMTKNMWNKYQDEYLIHKRMASEHITQLWRDYNDEERLTNQKVESSTAPLRNTVHSTKKIEDSTMAYPKNVIIFVRNIHPKSSKTTIRKLLEQSGAATAFVKHKKGLDSCHVRMASPEDTEKVSQYFGTHHLIQDSGIDSQGTVIDASTGASSAISVRAISGKEEEIYWKDDPKCGEMMT
ncbi:hypothetical protein BCR42DRAFT_488438 [Absidia repens]|uniref:RRM domain-containing protein n=1 Tax=Absidia repens TaxID=90262 RepID=A0A1X2IS27_9FUNG|nr:hypothetical protein BCR42DRAFT_488438 [Absidia repens]